MSRGTVTDRKATADEVRAHAPALRRLGQRLGVMPVCVREDGTVTVHAADAGYRQALEVSTLASEIVGAYVHVITDDVPGASDAKEL